MDSSIQFKEREILDIEIRPATAEDSVEIALNLREADRDEAQASYGLGPLEAIELSRLSSKECFVVLHRGTPSLIFGVSDRAQHPGQGCIWMLGTPDVEKFRKRFVRHSQGYLNELCAGYQTVMNYVDERHLESIRWLRSIGAEFTCRHERFGIEQRPFLEFRLKCV